MANTDEVLSALLLTLAAIFALGAITWLASLYYEDASLVDRVWGLLFMAGAGAAAYFVGVETPRTALLLMLVSLWALRLSAYLTWRNWGEGEDYRYREMRKGRQDHFAFWSLVWVFGLQGVLAMIIGMPLYLAIAHPGRAPLGWLDMAGLVVFVAGFLFEAVGDWQLARFKANPANKGKVMDQGLWRYTRHPNYFGNATLWWGIFVVSLSTPLGGYTIVGPILMTVLLLKVSGVAMLERTITERRPDYRAYIERTSAFIPWPPKRA